MGRSFSRVIATQVHAETVPWAKLMIKSLRKHCDLPLFIFAVGKNIPDFSATNCRYIEIDIDRVIQTLPHERVDRGVNDKVKSIIFKKLSFQYGAQEVLYIDADCLVLDSIDHIFRCLGDLLMAPERLDFYGKYLRAFDCEKPTLTFNAGVILFRLSFMEWWQQWYEKLFSQYNEEHAEGQTVWNLVWQKLPTAGILPQRYNQLHVKHGPHGAAIYHMAGLSANMKTAVMSNLYAHFYGGKS